MARDYPKYKTPKGHYSRKHPPRSLRMAQRRYLKLLALDFSTEDDREKEYWFVRNWIKDQLNQLVASSGSVPIDRGTANAVRKILESFTPTSFSAREHTAIGLFFAHVDRDNL